MKSSDPSIVDTTDSLQVSGKESSPQRSRRNKRQHNKPPARDSASRERHVDLHKKRRSPSQENGGLVFSNPYSLIRHVCRPSNFIWQPLRLYSLVEIFLEDTHRGGTLVVSCCQVRLAYDWHCACFAKSGTETSWGELLTDLLICVQASTPNTMEAATLLIPPPYFV